VIPALSDQGRGIVKNESLYSKGGHVRIQIVLVIALITAGCAASVNNYEKFYKPLQDSAKLQDVELLRPGQEPQIIRSSNLDADAKNLRAKQYIPVGSSSFNGKYEGEGGIKAQAARIGATVVLVYAANTSGHATAQRYDQIAWFFVKSTKKLKFGIGVKELTPEQKTSLGRDTGAIVEFVVENSPAFKANVLAGDILIEVNGVNVQNAKHALELMLGADVSKGTAVLKVIRNREEKVITITY
jgi:hypothetical protein